ncbi:hypothetical protein [Sporolactobacillus sp. THM19-2]|uniref:hypothetical protein n=1 Tax=Sporolactobacillus sp. THM19-2 TaxID=2511171 RepID=UPI00101FD4D2|nr:hypothetical protein [Sporolactobacillus sp. THM19-2]RYL92611.1 hypothetical protein EWH91_07045 [Sporolactobacillus sp. THM19-2]
MDTIAILQKTLDYVDEHITENITSEILAAHADFQPGISAEYFNGVSVFDYVIDVERKESVTIPDGYYTCEVPPASYAVFSTPPCHAESFASAIQGT